MIYTDVSQLPTFDAIQKLEWTASDEVSREPTTDTQIDSQDSVCSRHPEAPAGKNCELEGQVQTPRAVGVRHELAREVSKEEVAERAGFEPEDRWPDYMEEYWED